MHMATGNSECFGVALKFRHQGVASLRLYLDSTPHPDILRLCRALTIFLFADSILGDRAAMDIYVRFLKDLFQSHYLTLATELSFILHHFINIIYCDVQLAVMALSRTSFDLAPNKWVEKLFEPLWDHQLTGFSSTRVQADQSLDSCLQGELRPLLIDAQQIFNAVTEVRTNPSIVNRLTVFYIASKLTLTVGRLMDYFVRLDVDQLLSSEQDHLCPESSTRAKQDACACLCAVYWLREFAKIENICLTKDLRMFRANHTIMKKLRQVVERTVFSESISWDYQGKGSLRLLLWVLWTGASAENAASGPGDPGDTNASSGLGDDSKWFTDKLTAFSNQAGIKTCAECWEVLSQFLVPESLLSTDTDRLAWPYLSTDKMKE